MKILWCLFTLFVLCGADIEGDKVYCKPEQVHVAYGNTAFEMVVMWSTVRNCTTEVRYSVKAWDSVGANSVGGTVQLMPGNTSQVPYIHRATLTGLQPDATYFYIPVSNIISSNIFFFKTQSQAKNWQPEFLVYGDLGVHSQSLPKLNLEAVKGSYDAVLHVGDIAYDLFDTIDKGPNIGKNVGDVFMQRIQEMASHVPYMVSPGNHEIESETFYNYRYRYSTPRTDWPIPLDNMFYSMDVGPVHIISYSSEVFFVANGTYAEAQRTWLQQDLAEVNKNRDTRPWVIAMGHRPMYCSNGDGDDCTKPDSLVRAGLEDIFYEGGVDVVIQAHEHNYERLWPMYKGEVLAQNYSDPAGPVQLITGAAGTMYGPGLMNMSVHEPWTAFRLLNKSFNSVGMLKVYNHIHLYWVQKEPWTAFRLLNKSFNSVGVLKVYNHTHLYWVQKESWTAFRLLNKSFNSVGVLKVYNHTHLYWEQKEPWTAFRLLDKSFNSVGVLKVYNHTHLYWVQKEPWTAFRLLNKSFNSVGVLKVYNHTHLYWEQKEPWTAFRLLNKSFNSVGVLKVYNHTHLYWEQKEPWTAFRLLNKSFNSVGVLKVYNHTHLYWEQKEPWTAFRLLNKSFNSVGVLKVYNHTHLYWEQKEPWTAFRLLNKSFNSVGVLKVYNHTHLYWEQKEPWTAFRLLNKSFNSVGVLKVYNHTHLYWEQKEPWTAFRLLNKSFNSVGVLKVYNHTHLYWEQKEPWTAFRLLNKSFNSVGVLKVYNHTHLYWEQKGVLDGKLIDSIWITQHWHAPFTRPRTHDNRYHGDDNDNDDDDGDDGGESDSHKPDVAGDSLTEKVSKAIKGIDTKLAVGVISGLVVLVIFVVVIVMMRRRKKRDNYRRWDAADQKSYKHLQEEADEMEEIEIYNNTP